ncbi:hypothetical protein MT390_01820 [Vibrio sp. 2-Bac 85]
MLIFNCTKAAADFFSVKRDGKKITCIEPSPHKTIAESIASPVFPEDVDPQENGAFQWQWVVHCVTIQRKKYWLVTDYHSRYCIMFPVGKKGDNVEFLNSFESGLKANFRYWVDNAKMGQDKATQYIEQYNAAISTCAFYQRGDRSVQGNINTTAWYLESVCLEKGHLTEALDCLLFSVRVSEIPKPRPKEKEDFYTYKAFYAYWLKTFSPSL